MKWLTIEEIEARSETLKGALGVSYKHWGQLYSATAKELREEYERTNGLLDSGNHCGLCAYFDKCSKCIFTVFCVDNLWTEADYALENWYDKNEDGDWEAWKKASKAVRDKLKELMEQGSK